MNLQPQPQKALKDGAWLQEPGAASCWTDGEQQTSEAMSLQPLVHLLWCLNLQCTVSFTNKAAQNTSHLLAFGSTSHLHYNNTRCGTPVDTDYNPLKCHSPLHVLPKTIGASPD